MKTVQTIVVGALLMGCSFATNADSPDLEPLFGEWGNASQCEREKITPKGTKHFAPFVIKADWLGHGDVWCRLSWSTVTSTPGHLYTTASAICGEDSVRDYRIAFSLIDNELTLVWNLQHENGPVMRCAQ